MKNNTKILLLLMASILLASCKSWFSKDDDDKNPFKGMSAQTLYQSGEQALKGGEYSQASKRFEALDAMYPFSKYAEKSQLSLIYAYYKNEEYPSAAATAERYIHLYPRSTFVDYAYYMKGMANYQQTRGTFARFLPMDISWRDPGTQAQAYEDFSTLIRRFPKSPYSANARARLIQLRNQLAQKELHISKYYMKRKMYVAAVNRASYIVKNYSQSPQTKEALEIMIDANQKLGLVDAANNARKVLEATYANEVG